MQWMFLFSVVHWCRIFYINLPVAIIIWSLHVTVHMMVWSAMVVWSRFYLASCKGDWVHMSFLTVHSLSTIKTLLYLIMAPHINWALCKPASNSLGPQRSLDHRGEVCRTASVWACPGNYQITLRLPQHLPNNHQCLHYLHLAAHIALHVARTNFLSVLLLLFCNYALYVVYIAWVAKLPVGSVWWPRLSLRSR